VENDARWSTIEKPETYDRLRSAKSEMDTVDRALCPHPGLDTIGEECVIGRCSILQIAGLGAEAVEPSPAPGFALDTCACRPLCTAAWARHVRGRRRTRQSVELKKTRPGRVESQHGVPGRFRYDRASTSAGTSLQETRQEALPRSEGAFTGSNSTLVAAGRDPVKPLTSAQDRHHT